MFVNLNIVSASASHQASTGRPFSPTIPRAIPKNNANTTIWSTSPRAIASITDSGTTCSRIWSQVCGAPASSACCPIGRLTPTPGLNVLTADNLEVPGTGDPHDQRRKDQRRDHHFDQPQEQLCERTEVDRVGRVVMID